MSARPANWFVSSLDMRGSRSLRSWSAICLPFPPTGSNAPRLRPRVQTSPSSLSD